MRTNWGAGVVPFEPPADEGGRVRRLEGVGAATERRDVPGVRRDAPARLPPEVSSTWTSTTLEYPISFARPAGPRTRSPWPSTPSPRGWPTRLSRSPQERSGPRTRGKVCPGPSGAQSRYATGSRPGARGAAGRCRRGGEGTGSTAPGGAGRQPAGSGGRRDRRAHPRQSSTSTWRAAAGADLRLRQVRDRPVRRGAVRLEPRHCPACLARRGWTFSLPNAEAAMTATDAA